MTAALGVAQARQQHRAAWPQLPLATLDALLCAVAGQSRPQLYARPEAVLDTASQRQLGLWCRQLAAGYPLERLLHRCGFAGLELELSPDVLIPRPETEQLVELAAELLPGRGSAVDMGTGSGAVALALASLRPDAEVTGADVSAAALQVARRNAGRLGLHSVKWRQSNWFEALPGVSFDVPGESFDLPGASFDLVVSNPPYVEAGYSGLPELLRHDPELALVSGETGLECIDLLARQALPRTAPGGWLILEHAADRGSQVRRLLQSHGWTQCFTTRDFAGKERFSGGRRPPGP